MRRVVDVPAITKTSNKKLEECIQLNQHPNPGRSRAIAILYAPPGNTNAESAVCGESEEGAKPSKLALKRNTNLATLLSLAQVMCSDYALGQVA